MAPDEPSPRLDERLANEPRRANLNADSCSKERIVQEGRQPREAALESERPGRSRWLRWAKRATSGALFVVGACLLFWLCVYASGGKEHVLEYSEDNRNKWVAWSLLQGSLVLRKTFAGLGWDWQIYNGAVFTNWGYGVPLLQVPFHAAWRALHSSSETRFFPDRLIFVAYAGSVACLAWPTLARTFCREGERRSASSWLLGWCATLFAVATGFAYFLASRFWVYEETIAYLLVLEACALCFYLRSLPTESLVSIAAMAMAAGIGCLIRPTGAVYLAMWAALAVLHRPKRGTLICFLAAATPFVAFWMYSNTVRSGAPFSPGYRNINPGIAADYATQRFGSACLDSASSILTVTRQLISSLFWVIPNPGDLAARCSFRFDTKEEGLSPFLPPATLVLLGGSAAYYLTRKERRLALYVPHLTFLIILALFVYAGVGFCWRYIGDFLPLFWLIAIQFAVEAQVPRMRGARTALAVTLVYFSLVSLVRDITPGTEKIHTVSAATMLDWERIEAGFRTTALPAMPSRLDCVTPKANVYGNGAGWSITCDVGQTTNLYLSVPERAGSEYELRFRVQGEAPASLRVYVNGSLYTARREGDEYVAPIRIRTAKLYSPNVLISIEWARGPNIPHIKLQSVSLV